MDKVDYIIEAIMREASIHEFSRVWDLLEKVVARHGGYSKYDLFEALTERDLQAHVYENDGIKMAAITQIIEYPRLRSYIILFAGGTGLAEWKDKARAYFKSVARKNHCDEMQVIGRLGWARVYPDTKSAWAIYRDKL